MASHILPWKLANDIQRLDEFNGLALSPVYDSAFDKGLISFRADGRILINEEARTELRKIGVTDEDKIEKLDERHHFYLDWHRKNLFRKSNMADKSR